jgi:hypothetical protein
MRLAFVATDIRSWNGEHQERDDKRDASHPDKAPEFVQVDDGGAAFVWSLIARFFRKLKRTNRTR